VSARVSPTPGDRWADGWATRATTVAAVLVVAAVAAVVSYAHMQEVAERAGEQWRAWLLPLSVDGLVVAGSMVLLTRRSAGLPGGRLAWCALLGGVAASLAANIAAADDNVTARLVASWPAVAFAVAFELLLQQRRVLVVDRAGEPVGEVGEVGEVGDHRVGDADRVGDDPVGEVVDHPVGDHPVGDAVDHPPARPGEADDPVGEVVDHPVGDHPVGDADPVDDRIAQLVDAARTEGRPVGRRTVARELGITEYAAGQLLARTDNGDGRHAR